MDAGPFHQLHNAGQVHLLAVTDGIYFHFLAHDVAVYEHRPLFVDFYGGFQVVAQHFLIGYDFHCPSAQDEAGPDQNRIADPGGSPHTLFQIGDGFALGVGNP